MATDIIIPIYNAYDDLLLCLDSVRRHTNLQQNRLILINDNSSDERIRPYLDQQASEHVIVIHNETNQGFSNNINIGMAQSAENDVILLNSDTVVTEKWVEKMVACAYSDEKIGTVTPLSNNATLCSVPVFCEENSLPEGMSVDQMAAIVEACSMKQYPRITVAHGFCMLVKREVIDLVGNFDAETFGRGYGEENDFCNRAEQMGYIHVMCDDTYIYHSGTKSFVSKEKENYIREHDRILHERYPAQMHNNAVHCRDNPNGWVGRNIAYHMDIRNGKKNILYLLQADFREGADDNVGGTQLHVKHLVQCFRETMNVFVAARDKSYLQVTAYCGEREHVFRFRIGEKELFPVLHSRELAQLFHTILVHFQIGLVHVHHTATTSLDIFYEAEKLGIPVLYTAHDFYFACPNVKMLDVEGKVCVGRSDINCEECLQKKAGIYPKNDYLAMWRERHGQALDICKQIIVPSESAKEILGAYYPAQKKKIQVIEHGMDAPEILNIDESKIIHTDDLVWRIEKVDKKGRCPFVSGVAYFKDEPDALHKVILKVEDRQGKIIYLPTNFGRNSEMVSDENRFSAYLPNRVLQSGNIKISVILVKGQSLYMNGNQRKNVSNVVFSQEEKFKVGFIGGLNEEKGGKIAAEIIRKGPSDVEWYVIGGIGEEKLFNLKKNNLVKTGFYYQEDLATHLQYHGIDAICILSKWPETFSYTLSEAVLSKIPVIVTDIGALGQRVRANGYGELVSVDELKVVNEVIEKINGWKNKGEDYQAVKQRMAEHLHDNVEQMGKEYDLLYLKIEFMCHKKKKPERADLEKIYHAYQVGIDGQEGELYLISKIDKLQNRLDVIENGLTYKLLRKITKINIPFKQQLRKLITK